MTYENESKQIAVAYVKYRVASCRNLIGKPSSEIQPQLLAEHQNLVKTASEFVMGEPWYPGTLSVAGFIYGSFTAQIRFGDGYDWKFEAGFWGGVGAGSGAGGGPWGEGFVSPVEGEEMCFEVSIAGFSGGEIQAFWWRPGGPIIGSCVALAAGLGLGGGGGSGNWHRL
jgi:hypothetical protein